MHLSRIVVVCEAVLVSRHSPRRGQRCDAPARFFENGKHVCRRHTVEAVARYDAQRVQYHQSRSRV